MNVSETAIRIMESVGIELTLKKILVDVKNVRSQGGRFLDGTGVYKYVQVFSGNTFAVRDVFKRMGYKWNPELRGWTIDVRTDVEPTKEALCRVIAGK